MGTAKQPGRRSASSRASGAARSPATKKAAAKKAAPKKRAAKKAATKKAATPRKRAATKKAAAKRPAKKRASRKRAATKASWPTSPEDRWRPDDPAGEVCGWSFDGVTCEKVGAHYCQPRADYAVAFFPELLRHTKGPYARRAFYLEDWQERDIIRPLFGEVHWSHHWRCYVRRYTEAWIVLARKNGKSGLCSGIGLKLLVADGEESAEVYAAAKDTKQARKVWEPAERMTALSPTLADATGVNKNEKRIYYPATGSFFEVIPADALGELGHNPHGFILDEVLSQPNGELWGALKTGAGARLQPLFLAITTETNQPGSWGARQIDRAERIDADPSLAPHVFTYVRTSPRSAEQLAALHRRYAGNPDLPVSLDPWDERNWYWPNPALGTFLNIESLRTDAKDAREDPALENEFRQYRLNARVSQVTRWMPLDLWDGNGNASFVDEDELEGRPCFAGLDLSATTDLTSWCLLFPPGEDEPDGPWRALWRFWTPEALVPFFDKHLGGEATRWVDAGYLIATEGDWIDYDGDADGHSGTGLAVHPLLAADAARYRILTAGVDPHMAPPSAQHLERKRVTVATVPQGFGLSEALKELMRLTKAGRFWHGGNPVMRWNIDSAEVKRRDDESLKLVKPERDASSARVDGVAAAATALTVALAYDNARKTPATASSAAADPDLGDLYRPGRLSL